MARPQLDRCRHGVPQEGPQRPRYQECCEHASRVAALMVREEPRGDEVLASQIGRLIGELVGAGPWLPMDANWMVLLEEARSAKPRDPLRRLLGLRNFAYEKWPYNSAVRP